MVGAFWRHFVTRRYLLTAQAERGRYQQAMHFVTHEMQADQLGRLLGIIEEATDRVAHHLAQFLHRLRLRGDAVAEGGGAITTLLGFRHLKDDFGTHAVTMPEAI